MFVLVITTKAEAPKVELNEQETEGFRGSSPFSFHIGHHAQSPCDEKQTERTAPRLFLPSKWMRVSSRVPLMHAS